MTERAMGVGRRAREGMIKWNQMTALRFQIVCIRLHFTDAFWTAVGFWVCTKVLQQLKIIIIIIIIIINQ